MSSKHTIVQDYLLGDSGNKAVNCWVQVFPGRNERAIRKLDGAMEAMARDPVSLAKMLVYKSNRDR